MDIRRRAFRVIGRNDPSPRRRRCHRQRRANEEAATVRSLLSLRSFAYITCRQKKGKVNSYYYSILDGKSHRLGKSTAASATELTWMEVVESRVRARDEMQRRRSRK